NLTDPAFGTYGLWIASWGVAAPTVPAPWQIWACWQTGSGPVPGVAGACDLDEFNGADSAQFKAYGKPPRPPEKQPTNDDLGYLTRFLLAEPPNLKGLDDA